MTNIIQLYVNNNVIIREIPTPHSVPNLTTGSMSVMGQLVSFLFDVNYKYKFINNQAFFYFFMDPSVTSD